MGTKRKEDSPVKTALRVIEVMLMGCVGVLKGCRHEVDAHNNKNPNKQIHLKEVGSRNRGRISASILACMSTPSMQSNAEPK